MKWSWKNCTSIAEECLQTLVSYKLQDILKWIKHLNVRPESTKVVEENKGKDLGDCNIQGFWTSH